MSAATSSDRVQHAQMIAMRTALVVGTRTQWPAMARSVTSSVPTKPVPPSTQTVRFRRGRSDRN